MLDLYKLPLRVVVLADLVGSWETYFACSAYSDTPVETLAAGKAADVVGIGKVGWEIVANLASAVDSAGIAAVRFGTDPDFVEVE